MFLLTYVDLLFTKQASLAVTLYTYSGGALLKSQWNTGHHATVSEAYFSPSQQIPGLYFDCTMSAFFHIISKSLFNFWNDYNQRSCA
jgi:hypothetical protein